MKSGADIGLDLEFDLKRRHLTFLFFSAFTQGRNGGRVAASAFCFWWKSKVQSSKHWVLSDFERNDCCWRGIGYGLHVLNADVNCFKDSEWLKVQFNH